MTEAGANRLWRWLAWAWLLAMLALGVQQARFWQHPAIDTDVMALLPGSGEDAALALANRHLADSVTGDVVVLLSAGDWQHTRTAAKAFAGAIAHGRTLHAIGGDDAGALSAALSFYAPHRQGLLTAQHRGWLRKATPERNHIARFESALAGAAGNKEAETFLNLAIAKESEDLQDYDRAFASLVKGKAAGAPSTYAFAQDAAIFDAIEQAFAGPVPAESGCRGSGP